MKKWVIMLAVILSVVLLRSQKTVETGQARDMTITMIRSNHQPSLPMMPEPGNRRVVSDTFERGDTLGCVLDRHGVTASDVHAIGVVMDNVVPVRKLRAGADATVYSDSESGEMLEICIINRPDEAVRIVRNDDQWEAYTYDLHLFDRINRGTGTIRDSLWNAAMSQGVPPETILDMADLFGWQVDFTSGLRRDDSFDVFYRTRVMKDIGCVAGKISAARFTNAGNDFYAFGFTLSDGTIQYFDKDGESMRRTFLKTPLEYRRISSGYTHRRFHPILKVYRPHLGIDYAAPSGTPVSALGDGVVIFRGWRGGYGNYVEIQHGDAYVTCYGHLKGFGEGIRKGVSVRQGQVIGYVGSTGLSTGPHLDFRVRYRGTYINPETIKSEPAEPVPDDLRDDFFDTVAEWMELFGSFEKGDEYVIG
jgi:murein DD-endopeptidase MepM/ murein hydrolase activator NlpD